MFHGNAAILAAFLTAASIPAQVSPDMLLLKDFHPVPIHRIPVTEVPRAKFPVIDMHSHAYARTPEEVDQWVAVMDKVGIEKTIVLTGATGERFDNIREMYGRHGGRFELWCGIDYSRADQPDFGEVAVRELERCARADARGVGEISDKGRGVVRRAAPGVRIHPDDPRMDPVWRRCAELKLPVNLHVADPVWAYQPMNQHNDGLMNGWKWRQDAPDIVPFDRLIEILERTVKRHPRTIFIACHLTNLDYDLGRLAKLMDAYPNLYTDMSARFGETAATPRATAAFLTRYAGRVMYGTDMGRDAEMYRATFRILETLDEHFYDRRFFNYHWPLSGFGLPEPVLRKLYRETALELTKRLGK